MSIEREARCRVCGGPSFWSCHADVPALGFHKFVLAMPEDGPFCENEQGLRLEYEEAVFEIDYQVSTGEWDFVHRREDSRFRSRQVHALLKYVMRENAELKRRLDRLEQN
jgi:hypothetical protein